MKKTYINPEMLVVKIATQQMLASSSLGIGTGDKDPVTADSRMLDDEFFDEEEELEDDFNDI